MCFHFTNIRYKVVTQFYVSYTLHLSSYTLVFSPSAERYSKGVAFPARLSLSSSLSTSPSSSGVTYLYKYDMIPKINAMSAIRPPYKNISFSWEFRKQNHVTSFSWGKKERKIERTIRDTRVGIACHSLQFTDMSITQNHIGQNDLRISSLNPLSVVLSQVKRTRERRENYKLDWSFIHNTQI